MIAQLSSSSGGGGDKAQRKGGAFPGKRPRLSLESRRAAPALAFPRPSPLWNRSDSGEGGSGGVSVCRRVVRRAGVRGG